MGYPKKKTDIDIAALRKTFRYDVATGALFHTDHLEKLGGRVGCPKFIKAGERAGGVKSNGYRYIGFGGGRWLAHVLVWAYVNGHIPSDDIDHINRERDDNRIENLRVVTRGQNMRNCARNDRRGKALGTRQIGDKWAAQVSDNGRTINLGFFNSQDEAHAAHVQYVEKHGLRA